MISLAVASMLAIGAGTFCLTDTDYAWEIYELDHRMYGFAPPRIRQWKLRVRQVGVLLIALGMIGLTLSLR